MGLNYIERGTPVKLICRRRVTSCRDSASIHDIPTGSGVSSGCYTTLPMATWKASVCEGALDDDVHVDGYTRTGDD
jgi:hypothetical protein